MDDGGDDASLHRDGQWVPLINEPGSLTMEIMTSSTGLPVDGPEKKLHVQQLVVLDTDK